MSEEKQEQSEQPPVDTITLTIDGVEVTVDKGTNIIEAAKAAGTTISAFCYHPGLEVVAVCRQCLVSVEGAPKLIPACQGTASEGMVVHTKDDASSDARRQLLEFTLLNHPVDCPICDKAGECTLQKHYMEHNAEMSRSDVPKVHKPKNVDLGPEIILDAERCILCTRCIRVCDEVAGEHQLEINQRGDHSELGTAPGQVLDNPYSLNTVDVCPVGALTAKDFRFAMRAWELLSTPSVCSGCSTGCNIEIHHRGAKTYRIIPRENLEVNGHWMCDRGRFLYHNLSEGRLLGPLVGGMPARWANSLKAAASKISAVLEADSRSMGVVFSPHRSNEENYALAKLVRDTWKIDRVYIGGNAEEPEDSDDRLRRADKSPNRAGVLRILENVLGDCKVGDQALLESDIFGGELKGLIVMGHELTLSDAAVARTGGLDCLVVIADHEEGITKQAHVSLAAAAWAEYPGSVTNYQGRVQRTRAAYEPMGQAKPAWEILSDLAKACDSTIQFESAEQVFNEMLKAVPAFSTAKWGRDTLPIQLRFANSRG